MCGDVFDHMSFLSKTPVTNVASEGFFARVNLQMLLEIEPFGIDEESANGATLVIRPVIIHVQIEVIKVVQLNVALDAINRPHIVLDLVLIIRHRCLIGRVPVANKFLFFWSI